MVFWWYANDVYMIFGWCLDDVWMMLGLRLGDIWVMCEWFFRLMFVDIIILRKIENGKWQRLAATFRPVLDQDFCVILVAARRTWKGHPLVSWSSWLDFILLLATGGTLVRGSGEATAIETQMYTMRTSKTGCWQKGKKNKHNHQQQRQHGTAQNNT